MRLLQSEFFETLLAEHETQYQKIRDLFALQKRTAKKISQTQSNEIKFTVHPIGTSDFIQFSMFEIGINQAILGAYRKNLQQEGNKNRRQ